jgi:hypothetical protein
MAKTILEKKKTCYKVTVTFKNNKYVRFFQTGDLNIDHHDAVVFIKSINSNGNVPTPYLFNQYRSRNCKLIPITMQFE